MTHVFGYGTHVSTISKDSIPISLELIMMELNLDRFNLDGWKRHYQGKKGGIKSFDVQPSKMNLVLVKLVHYLWIMSTPNTSTALSSIIYPSGLLTQKFWGRLSELYQRVTVKSRGRVFKAERERLFEGETTIFKWYRCGPFVSMHLRQMSK